MSLVAISHFCMGHILVLALCYFMCPCIHAELLYTKKKKKKSVSQMSKPYLVPYMFIAVHIDYCT